MVRGVNSQQSQKPLKFDQKLILFQWMLSLFEVLDFDRLTADLKDPSLERFDENNISLYYHQLMLRLWDLKELPSDVLLAYDNNIVRHWKKITEKRNQIHTLYPKYFQYLSLLFTEIYLDRYFRDPENLLASLNAQVSAFNAGQTQQLQLAGILDSSQLFGRGVRLKGFEYCLKRSRQIQGISASSDIEILENLNIFGIRADYMRQFKEYLEDEGLPTNENRIKFVILFSPFYVYIFEYVPDMKHSL